MSGERLNNYTQLDTNILEMQLTEDASFIGKHTVSLTNYNATTESKIAAGSKIEVNGSLYKFTADETITGTVSDGIIYIYIIPAGATCTAEYTNTAPTWDDAKQGFYGTSGTANYRYLEFILYRTSTTWNKKEVFNIRDKNINNLFRSYLMCTMAGNQDTTTETRIAFDTKSTDYNGEFSTANNTFTAVKKGLYLFLVQTYISNLDASSVLRFYKESAVYGGASQYAIWLNTGANVSSAIIPLEIGEDVYITCAGDASFRINANGSSLYIAEL